MIMSAVHRLYSVRADAVKVEPLRWVLGMLLLGHLNVVVGKRGEGKSAVMSYVAARVTTGDAGGDLFGKPEPVLISSMEDPHEVVVARMTAANADRTKVHIMREGLNLPDDILLLENEIRATGAKLAILDPLSSHIGRGVNTWKDHSVRLLMAKLARVASDLDVAVVLVAHLNKTTRRDALDRVSGSGAFVNAARSVVHVVRDPAEQAVGMTSPAKLLVQTKSNYATTVPPIRFRTVSATVSGDGGQGIQTVGIEWLGPATHRQGSEAVDADSGLIEDSSAVRMAVRFLADYLKEGPRPSADVKKAAAATMVSTRTLWRAARILRVRTRKDGVGGLWTWSLT